MAAQTIDEVLQALDAVVDRARRDASRLGYFAAVYRKVTAKVKQGIDEGFFDDGERMRRLDVVFANRYLEALAQFERGQRPTRSWELALAAAAGWRPIILQHLLVGINAHINLDLGIAAAQTAPGQALAGLRRDFDRINEILALLIAQIQRDIDEVSPWIALLDRIGGRSDEELVKFSLEVARTTAWWFATELAPLDPDQWAGATRARDTSTARMARVVLHPGLLSAGLLAIRSRETNQVPRVIDVLSRVRPPALETVEARVRQARGPGTAGGPPVPPG
ncbi:MAG: DUF5995 family protein [Actinomycetota bacterium]|nr:DUF5995 family protein [Actinomycetota bacterium]